MGLKFFLAGVTTSCTVPAVLSTKWTWQHRNIFIDVYYLWAGVLTGTCRLLSTAYRWITTAAIQAQYSDWEEAKLYALFPCRDSTY
ncbi:hypothetical protein PILCRDRAFT_810121 [Piloderma croceum F 1598]|uniref:Uncharacterized protein n=1 Tax=Piloderma croceum (strain F 1598) TaxID=765440 RepID=A0A0C3CR50_PILCF|nr:hypothetical protein PILCRDRAFT_810121 [Piloderma croceum F 1598]